MKTVTTMNELGGTIVTAEHPAGLLTFEDFGVGQWLTQKGEPAKTSRRRYLLDGQSMDAVSSLCGTLSKEALVDWAGKASALGARDATRAGELDGVHDDDVIERLRFLGLGHKAKQQEGADRGNAIHAVAEGIARYGLMPDPSIHPPAYQPYLQGFARAWLELGITPVEIEEMVCHKKLGYAGRPDLVGTNHDGLVLVDYKTGKGKVYDQAHYQTRLYEMARVATGLPPADRIVIVGISDEGVHELVDCEASEEDALHLLWTFRSRKNINAGMARQRKERKARLKEQAKRAELAAAATRTDARAEAAA